MRLTRRRDPAQASPESESLRSRTDNRRRGFLLALGVGGAGAAALAARSLTGVAPQGDAAAPSDDAQGYRLSDHVKRYYQTTKI